MTGVINYVCSVCFRQASQDIVDSRKQTNACLIKFSANIIFHQKATAYVLTNLNPLTGYITEVASSLRTGAGNYSHVVNVNLESDPFIFDSDTF